MPRAAPVTTQVFPISLFMMALRAWGMDSAARTRPAMVFFRLSGDAGPSQSSSRQAQISRDGVVWQPTRPGEGAQPGRPYLSHASRITCLVAAHSTRAIAASTGQNRASTASSPATGSPSSQRAA